MKKLLSLILTLVLVFSAGALAACKPRSDIELDDEGNIIGGKANVTFWGWGDEEELKVFNSLVNSFNAANPNITVTFADKGTGYGSATYTALSGRGGPDVVYVGDSDLKSWVYDDLLLPLDNYLATSKEIKPDEIWDSAFQRYRYDPVTAQSRPTDPVYAMPKDIGPTVIYYNENAFQTVGVEIISVDAEDMAAYNEAHQTNYPDDSGFFLVEGSSSNKITSIPYEVNQRAPLVNRMKSATKRVFNNRIAMTWEESVALAMLNTKDYNSSAKTDFGYFTEWWFSYGWSVGGDCIKLNDDGEWEFSLGDKTLVGDNTASIFDAFAHFVSLSQPSTMTVAPGVRGLAITPTPSAIKSTGKTGYFTSQRVAMMVEGRFNTVTYRKALDTLPNGNPNKFTWDVAPLPKHKDGVEAGHSGSVGLAINKKSYVQNAAWKFIEYISGETGQKAQAETGFNLPNQKALANSDVFLQPDKNPKNSIVFIRAAQFQRAGDWTLMPDRMWIEEWAPILNSDVRDGTKSLDEFFAEVTKRTNDYLKTYQLS